MAITGLSIPVYGIYHHDGNGRVTYSEPAAASKAVEYSAEFESSESNDFYADNMIAETAAGQFADGTLTVSTADMPGELARTILGLKLVKREVGGEKIDELVYDDDQKSPDLGFGIIEEHINDGKTGHVPVLFPRVRFNIPNNAATTRGAEIDWQTKELTARIMRSEQVDENYKHPWQISPAKAFESEAKAKNYLLKVLGQPEVMEASKASIPPKGKEILGGLAPEDFITDGTVISKTGEVVGTLKYISDFKAFSSDTAEQSGHYFPIHLGDEYKGKNIKCVGTHEKTATDTEWLLLVKNNASTFKFTNETDGSEEILTLTFKTTTFEKG